MCFISGYLLGFIFEMQLFICSLLLLLTLTFF